MTAVARFAAAEARITAATYRHLANAIAGFAPPAGGSGAAVEGVPVIFDAAMAMVDEQTGVLIERPVLRVQAGSVPGLAERWTVSGLPDTYRVRQAQPMDEGRELRLVLVKE